MIHTNLAAWVTRHTIEREKGPKSVQERLSFSNWLQDSFYFCCALLNDFGSSLSDDARIRELVDSQAISPVLCNGRA